MRALRPTVLSSALLACALFSPASQATGRPEPAPENPASGASAKPAQPQMPLRSRAEVDAWLKAQEGRSTPFDAFSAGARERVLTTLHFYDDGGLGSPPVDELSWEMNRHQALAWLKLFGREEWIDMIQFHPPTPNWKGDSKTPSAMDQRVAAYERDEQSTYDSNGFQYERNVSNLYRKYFPATLIDSGDRLSDADLLLLARTSASVAGFTSGEAELDDLMKLMPLLQARGGLDLSPLAIKAQRALMSLGRLDQARALAAHYPSVKFDQIPDVMVAATQLPAGPKWWRLAPDGQSVTAESADLTGTQIFILAGCHFSIDALDEIQRDPDLAPVFAAHAHWLGQPLGNETIEDWQAWQAKFPNTPMHLVTLRHDWPMFPTWTMPTYVVVHDGKVVDQTTGSLRNRPENRVALVEMLRRHGLMPAAGGKTASVDPMPPTRAN